MRQPPATSPRNQAREIPARPRRRALGAALAAALAACALNPVTKAPEISFTSLEEEKAAGAEGAERIAEQIGLVKDDALLGYVQSVGARLAAGSPRKDIEYTFEIIDADFANAFALPAGHIYVSRGLLALLSDESELAGVLAHQIGHAAARHSSNSTLGSAASGVLSGIGNIAGGVFGFASFSQLGRIGSIVPPHSSDQEEQADQIGQELAASAGWDPAGITQFIRAYERSKTDRTQVESGFLQVHPSSAARLQAERERSTRLGKPAAASGALDRAAFLAKLRGLVIGQDARAGVFDAKVPTLFLQPDLNFRIRFPDGWSTINAPAFVGGSDGAVQITLEPAGEGTDVKKAAVEYAARKKKERDEATEKAERSGKKKPPAEDFNRTKSGVRMLTKKRTGYVIEGTSQGGQATILQYFVDVPPNVFLVTCAMATQAKGQYLGDCRRTAASVGPMRKKERESIRQTTLQIGEARAGESLEDFSGRVHNAWSIPQTAGANALSLPYALSAGQLLKYAEAKPYQPAPQSPATSTPPAPDTPDEVDVPETDAPGDDD